MDNKRIGASLEGINPIYTSMYSLIMEKKYVVDEICSFTSQMIQSTKLFRSPFFNS